ncbi:MAG: hypothetical protein ACLTSZ_06685 [Lachnospiraceae bacterium]
MKFSERYKKMNEACGQNQFLVPYLMSSHPGCTMEDAVELACFLRDLGYMPEQVQDFYPTPATVSTLYVLYRTGSADDAAGLCGEKSASQGASEGIDPVPAS